ncbi:MAG: glycoside hydrolase family 13 protein, partial [Clostridia bacterium]|nr:glycoside hydrolase family 13 protein [Clostridia bacterium]
EEDQKVHIEKRVKGEDVSLLGAFPCGTVLTVTATVPRTVGAAAVVLRIAPDGGEETDLPMQFFSTEQDKDRYELTLDTAALCNGQASGLFYYEYLFVRGWDTLFSDSINNVDFTLSNRSASRFRLLVYEKEYTTPAWFRGGTMYHIFVDRFFRGEGESTLRAGASINPDWHHGIPQYARIPGEPLANNVFFGGNLWGVAQKLDYLSSLGVTVIYLSPIFESASNHRYDTGDYEKIDGLLGGEKAFDHLIKEAHARGIKVILDGVFNHTGDDSKYFNRRGNYASVGAYQSKSSPYADWYSFREFPDSYECWWGIEIMPRLCQNRETCRSYFTGADGIAKKWLLRGADGWRLDVADELPDCFLDELRQVAKQTTDGEAVLIGEVWENAADKIAYGKRRRYFSGRQLDSVMNYPFRNAVLAFLNDGDAELFYNILTELYASYPRDVSNSLMNLLGTHDTERILTVLGSEGEGEDCTNDELAHLRLTLQQRAKAIQKLMLASTLQYTAFGIPSLYYGDEAGLEGYHDPFCRLPYPWGEEESVLLEHYRRLGALREKHSALKNGDFCFTAVKKDAFAYERRDQMERLLILANMGTVWNYPLSGRWKNALTGEAIKTAKGTLAVPPAGFFVLEKC